MFIVNYRLIDTLHNGRGDLAPTAVFVIVVWGVKCLIIVDFRLIDTLHNGRGDLAPTAVFVIVVWGEMSH